ncbi:MAG: hypothetical protein V4511_04515 [Bacteroidota bacterium]
MFKKGDRVRFKDKSKDKAVGILIILDIKNGIATCCSGDYNSFGSQSCNTNLIELEKSE